MKRFIRKRWFGIPVVLLVAVLVMALTAGSVMAAYTFQTVAVTVDVEEAIVLGLFDTWDNLEPYGSVDDVDITPGGTPSAPTMTISTVEGYAGAGFVAGEWIVIPVNFRNAGDGTLNLGASVSGAYPLVLEYTWEMNPFPATSWGPEGQSLHREFKATETWAPLSDWTGTIAGNGGKSGSAICGATVLFVRISAPGDMAPGTYTFNVAFSRS